MGYRYDFEKMKITLTGGIYIRTFPASEQIIIDSKIKLKPKLFSNDLFVQSLLPKSYTVLVKKTGYYDYFKTIPVLEKEVTKLENIILFKKDIDFSVVDTKITPSPFEKLTPEKPAILAKKIVAFAEQNKNIIWLGTDGFLYKSDLANLTVEPIKLTLTALKISKTGIYKIIVNNKDIFVNNNGNLLLWNTSTNELDNFYSPVKDAKISPDGNSIVYYNNTGIYISPLPNTLAKKNTLYKISEKINNCIWLNNNYIIFTDGLPGQENKIIISEIDYRGEVNTITLAGKNLPQTTSSQIYFDQQESKLYIQTDSTLLVSEKLIP